ncbi:hypothetical protein [Thiomonas bhubaneswarensis]|uniref:Uncharacterized protein n=1 Tax=Thiomonas bhubaneswarensis TaxID=339866 RepID=A0A0K6I549_9BURK|nr:hypothetical protein [Thiomonas bhubaneswarensis]CUA98211.1 hypothetical protein Ga0061069_1079 [Thiomonas bhubaneswarensis]
MVSDPAKRDLWKRRIGASIKRVHILRQARAYQHGMPLHLLRQLRDLVHAAKHARGDRFEHRGLGYVIQRRAIFDRLELEDGTFVCGLGGGIFRD